MANIVFETDFSEDSIEENLYLIHNGERVAYFNHKGAAKVTIVDDPYKMDAKAIGDKGLFMVVEDLSSPRTRCEFNLPVFSKWGLDEFYVEIVFAYPKEWALKGENWGILADPVIEYENVGGGHSGYLGLSLLKTPEYKLQFGSSTFFMDRDPRRIRYHQEFMALFPHLKLDGYNLLQFYVKRGTAENPMGEFWFKLNGVGLSSKNIKAWHFQDSFICNVLKLYGDIIGKRALVSWLKVWDGVPDAEPEPEPPAGENRFLLPLLGIAGFIGLLWIASSES